MMKAKTLCSTFVVSAMLTMAPLGLSAKTLGMVADINTASVTVFDADNHAVLGTVPTPGIGVGDVVITPDLKRGFVTNHNYEVFVIDLTTSPPSLSGGTNPIPISNVGVELSISPNGKFLVVSGIISAVEPISVIDIAAQDEISAFSPDFDVSSLDVCSDGSVLTTSYYSAPVHRLTLSGTGTLTDTGEALSVSEATPINVYCAPGAASGVVVQTESIEGAGGVRSFTIPGLAAVNARGLSQLEAVSGAITPAGNRVFVRSGDIENGPGMVDVFNFNSSTGALGTSPLLTFSVADVDAYYGIDQVALHPNGTKLFVSEPSAVSVYNPSTGVLLASITDPAIVVPTGVTVVTKADSCAGAPPAGAIVGTNGPNILKGTRGNDTIFGLGGRDIIDGGAGNDVICGGSGNDRLFGGAGKDKLFGGTGKDKLFGGAGKDKLFGGTGNDALDGGSGSDLCDGGDSDGGDGTDKAVRCEHKVSDR